MDIKGLVMWAVLILVFIGYLAWRKQEAGRSAHKSGWYTGPKVNGKSFSSNVAAQPTMGPEGLFIDMPVGKGSLNYLTCFDPPPMKNAKEMRLRFRIDAASDVRFIAQDANASPIASVGLVIQRKGDTWQDGKFESFRWFCDAEVVLEPGEFELVVPLNVQNWSGMMGGKDPRLLVAALNEVDNYGVVFGSAGGRGHGVFTSSPARFTLLELTVS